MSVKALSAVFEESQARGAAFTVLLAMADWANHIGRCYPSYGQIASKARVSRATAIAAIQELIDLGEIERVEGGQEPTPTDDEDEDAPRNVRSQWRNLYRIRLVKPKRQVVQPGDHLSPPQVVQSSDHLSRSKKSEVVQSASAGSPIHAAQVVQSTDLHIRIRPSGRPSGRPSEERQAVAAPPPPDKPTTEKPDPHGGNFRVIEKLAHQTLDQLGDDADDLDVIEAVKQACADFHIPNVYSGTVLAAIDSARWQRQHRSREG